MEKRNYSLENVMPRDMRDPSLEPPWGPRIYKVSPKESGRISLEREEGYEDNEGFYLIVGREVDLHKFGLSRKVAGGEASIKVPIGLIKEEKL